MAEDIERRDFTCNALVLDNDIRRIIDLTGGFDDIRKRRLRHIHDDYFALDPLRVLRMCRFAAQLDFEIAPETMVLARKMVAKRTAESSDGGTRLERARKSSCKQPFSAFY